MPWRQRSMSALTSGDMGDSSTGRSVALRPIVRMHPVCRSEAARRMALTTSSGCHNLLGPQRRYARPEDAVSLGLPGGQYGS